MNTQTATFTVKARGISGYDFGEHFVCVYFNEWHEEREEKSPNFYTAKTKFVGQLIVGGKVQTTRIELYCYNQSIINKIIEIFTQRNPLLLKIENGEIIDWCLWKMKYT